MWVFTGWGMMKIENLFIIIVVVSCSFNVMEEFWYIYVYIYIVTINIIVIIIKEMKTTTTTTTITWALFAINLVPPKIVEQSCLVTTGIILIKENQNLCSRLCCDRSSKYFIYLFYHRRHQIQFKNKQYERGYLGLSLLLRRTKKIYVEYQYRRKILTLCVCVCLCVHI